MQSWNTGQNFQKENLQNLPPTLSARAQLTPETALSASARSFAPLAFRRYWPVVFQSAIYPSRDVIVNLRNSDPGACQMSIVLSLALLHIVSTCTSPYLCESNQSISSPCLNVRPSLWICTSRLARKKKRWRVVG